MNNDPSGHCIGPLAVVCLAVFAITTAITVAGPAIVASLPMMTYWDSYTPQNEVDVAVTQTIPLLLTGGALAIEGVRALPAVSKATVANEGKLLSGAEEALLNGLDDISKGHSNRVGNMMADWGASGFSNDELKRMGYLHDVGKARPDILKEVVKTKGDTTFRFDIVQEHVLDGYDRLNKVGAGYWEKMGALSHHPYFGVPLSETPEVIQRMRVVDMYDALVNSRSYKDAFPVDEAFKILYKDAMAGKVSVSAVDDFSMYIRGK